MAVGRTFGSKGAEMWVEGGEHLPHAWITMQGEGGVDRPEPKIR
jgi:hypothetical protein